eukprot:TRINITY_DN11460_c0_g1::TRINITY_DN11460_c0_g1_i1::g.10839::m.10839 TRINITY_DN11460_c0_g1::TRINITY_DN11460_c0_g1_i1::g.10839  ORF type:complete len:257 (+),score=83.35,Clathrin_lg_ch/PF01086.12/2.8e-16,Lipid_bd/PF12888.2/1.4e+02,Lipid_bd/PF12888.2/0.0055 TRINITY_DN11460_c0_g1_i1:52-771(+)
MDDLTAAEETFYDNDTGRNMSNAFMANQGGFEGQSYENQGFGSHGFQAQGEFEAQNGFDYSGQNNYEQPDAQYDGDEQGFNPAAEIALESDAAPSGDAFDFSAPVEQPIIMSRPFTVDDTPEPVRLWRERRNADLEEKERKASDEISRRKTQALVDLKAKNQERIDHITRIKKINRDAEKAFLEERDATEHSGNPWDSVVSMIETKDTKNKDKKEVSAMRHALFEAKNAFPNAPPFRRH